MSIDLNNLKDTNITHRSGIEAFRRCPRLRLLNYHWDTIGIVPTETYIPLVTGGAVHLGVQVLMQDLKVRGKVVLKGLLQESIDTALNSYKQTVESARSKWVQGYTLLPQEEYTYHEQLALVEALVILFAVKALPSIAADYKVLDVETPEAIRLSPDIVMVGRCDSILQRLQDNAILVLSLKTTERHPLNDERRESSIYHDLQGISEMMLLHERLEDNFHKLQEAKDSLESITGLLPVATKGVEFIDKLRGMLPPVVTGVRMLFLIKGIRRDYSKGTNDIGPVTYSPLIRGYRKETGEGTFEYAHTYTHDGHRLGKGWKPFNVWEAEDVGFIKGWIKQLRSGVIQPEIGDVLANQIYFPNEYYRNYSDLESLKVSVIQQETMVFKALAKLKEAIARNEDTDELLNKHFPMYQHSCDYPRKCSYQSICYDSVVAINPMSTGKFMPRTPHHEAERIKYGI